MSSAVLALCTRQIVLGCLILAYAQMQLSEMMIWYGIDHNKPEWNKRGTTYGKYLLATHNIAIGIGILMSIIFISKKKVGFADFIPLIIGIIFFAGVIVFIYLPFKYPDMTYPLKQTCDNCKSPDSSKHLDEICSGGCSSLNSETHCDRCRNSDNRLRWPYPHWWYILSYLLSVLLMMLWVKPIGSKLVFLSFFTVTFILAGVLHAKTVGSVWCLSTSILAPIVVLVNYCVMCNVSSSLLLT